MSMYCSVISLQSAGAANYKVFAAFQYVILLEGKIILMRVAHKNRSYILFECVYAVSYHRWKTENI